MGYADKSEKNFSSRFCRHEGAVETAPTISHAEWTDCSSGKLNLISDFLQEIAAQWFPSSVSIKKQLAHLPK
jgi:hypothetical protein